MAHVVTEPCVGCQYTDCVVVCPMECFYGDESQLYIDPIDCIDCGACVTECPVGAIYRDHDVPSQYQQYIMINEIKSQQLKQLGMRVTEKKI